MYYPLLEESGLQTCPELIHSTLLLFNIKQNNLTVMQYSWSEMGAVWYPGLCLFIVNIYVFSP